MWLRGSCIVIVVFAFIINGTSRTIQEDISKLMGQADTAEEIDSLINLFTDNAYDELLDWEASLIKLYALAEELEYKKGQARILDKYGTRLMNVGQFEGSIEQFFKLIQLAREQPEAFELELAHLKLSSPMCLAGQYENAVFELTQCIKICLENNNEATLAKAYNNIAMVYTMYLDDNRLALHNMEKAMELAEKADDSVGQVYSGTNCSILYVKLEEYKKAAEMINGIFPKALELQDSSLLQFCRSTRGLVLANIGEVEEALVDIRDAKRYYQRTGEKIYYAETLEYEAIALRAQQKFSEALALDLEAKVSFEEMGGGVYLLTAFHNLYEDYKGLNNYEKALYYLEQEKTVKDSLQLVKGNKFTNLVKLFELEKTDMQVAAIHKNNTIRNQRLIFFLALFGVVALLSLLLFSRQKQLREKDNQIFKLKEEKLLLSNKTNSQRINELNKSIAQLQEKEKGHKLSIQTLNQKLANYVKQDAEEDRQQILNRISEIRFSTEKDWELFRQQFSKIYPGFFDHVNDQYKKITRGELKLMALLKLNLSTHSVAEVLGISKDGVRKSKYRLRKKLGILEDSDLKKILTEL